MSKVTKQIVIADDNRELSDLIVDIMKQEGYDTSQVYDGYELISFLEKNNPSLVILDLMMPEKDGISILDTIRQLVPNLKVVIYTGYQEYEKSVYARSADKFIVKGGSITELINAIKDLIG